MTPQPSNRKQTPVGYDRPRELGGPISQGSKSAEFIAGAFGLPGIQVVLSVFIIMAMGNLLKHGGGILFLILVEGLVSVGIFAWASGSGRQYLAKGYLSAISGLVVVVLLVFGACAALLQGLR